MIGRQMEIRDKLKPIDRRVKVLDEHIRQTDNYGKYKSVYKQYQQQKPTKKEAFAEAHRAELALYETANGYLKAHLNGRGEIPLYITGKKRKSPR